MTRAADREDFDADREFVIVRGMRLGGKDYTPGQDFDKHLCNTRKLRQLYDQRLINMAPPRYQTYVSPTAKFDAMSLDELRGWLGNHGIVARATWDRAKLLEKVMAIEESVAA